MSSHAMTMKPAHEVIGGLKDAQTLRDIYRVPFPVSSSVISNSSVLNDFHAENKSGLLITSMESDSNGNEVWETPEVENDLREVFETIADLDRVSGFDGAKKMRLDMRGPNYSRLTEATTTPHVDGGTMPRMRVYFYASSSPTYVVPHDITLALLERHTPALLDMPFEDPNFYRSFSDIRHDLSHIFSKVAAPIYRRELTAISGVTLHFMPSVVEPDRRFLRARIFET